MTAFREAAELRPEPELARERERAELWHWRAITADEAAKIVKAFHELPKPVYVHCSAGKHRAGTICAVYRTRVEGWSLEQAWAEQASPNPDRNWEFTIGTGLSSRTASTAPPASATRRRTRTCCGSSRTRVRG